MALRYVAPQLLEECMSQADNVRIYTFNVFADNFQFLVLDKRAECHYPETWNDEMLEHLFAMGEQVLGIGTVRDLDVPVEVIIHEQALEELEVISEVEFSRWDHVVQAVIDIPSGVLMLHGPTQDLADAEYIELPAGRYGIRVFWQALDDVDAVGFEGNDSYHLELWPDTEFMPMVLKSWRMLRPQFSDNV